MTAADLLTETQDHRGAAHKTQATLVFNLTASVPTELKALAAAAVPTAMRVFGNPTQLTESSIEPQPFQGQTQPEPQTQS